MQVFDAGGEQEYTLYTHCAEQQQQHDNNNIDYLDSDVVFTPLMKFVRQTERVGGFWYEVTTTVTVQAIKQHLCSLPAKNQHYNILGTVLTK